jgi:dephospho-CoA kinase
LLSTFDTSSEEVLKEAIKRELLDENTHPRIRKNFYEKYYSSIKRLMDASILPEAKLALILIHNELIEELLNK